MLSYSKLKHYKLLHRGYYIALRQYASNKYTDTLNLPKSSFPLSMKDGAARKREKQLQQSDIFRDLYNWQWKNRSESKSFILHDGPPYANGDPHVGHALNKIMKDITTRHNVMCGNRVHYVPGWDCHGVPIEQKALADIKCDHTTLDPLLIRQKAKDFAEKAIKKQAKAFKTWGVMADWKNNCYFTMNKFYEMDQLEVFLNLYEKGFIYQNYMPVFWSPSSRTALAEAELEYNDKHISQAVYVKFPIKFLPPALDTSIKNEKPISTVIWTTTPWTLPANQAICYGPGIQYSLVQSESKEEIFLISSEFTEKLCTLLGSKLTTLKTFQGCDLEGTLYQHPLYSDSQLTFLPANHVTVSKGTGLVHTAPAHGPDDFQIAIAHKLPVTCMVDEAGLYTEAAGEELMGKAVLTGGNSTVLSRLKSYILHQEDYQHSYPYDWRTKEPVILRASKQWFVNTEQIKDTAVDCLGDVKIIPRASSNSMLAQLAVRTYWCISRQRAWGVPIPVFYEKNTGEVLLNRTSVEHIKSLVGEKGTDCWWSSSVEELLPTHVIEKSGFPKNSKFEKGMDILDIWFDSGVSWANVLKDHGKIADVYIEGIDQFGGWFQSSLLTSIAARGVAPYKSLVVHGFTMDESGHKMSKSIGNVVDPVDVINGSKEKGWPSYGVDVLRWWVGQAGLDQNVQIGPSILHHCNEQVFKLRKSIRYLIGNLADFKPGEHCLDYICLLIQDQYMLHLLHEFISQVRNAYSAYDYCRVLELVEKFNNTYVSAFYIHVTKDRLYCSSALDNGVQSSLTVQMQVLDALLKSVAPVLPHLAEEVHQYTPMSHVGRSVFHSVWNAAPSHWNRLDIAAAYSIASAMRDTLYSYIQSENPVQFDIVICAKGDTFSQLKLLQEEMSSHDSALCEFFQTSTTSVLSRPPLVIPDDSMQITGTYTKPGEDASSSYLLVILPAEYFQCERCRRHRAKRPKDVCNRCADVLDNQ